MPMLTAGWRGKQQLCDEPLCKLDQFCSAHNNDPAAYISGKCLDSGTFDLDCLEIGHRISRIEFHAVKECFDTA